MTDRDGLTADGRLIPASNPTGTLRTCPPLPVVEGEPTNEKPLDAERRERS